MANSIWKDYFTFNKGERLSVFILLGIMALGTIGPYYYARQFKSPVIDTALQQQLNSLLQNADEDSVSATLKNNQSLNNSSTATTEGKLFYFNPNTLDADGFKQLGLRDKTIQTIINYRNKGGYFKNPEDIGKIYGLHKDEAERLIPYVHIQNDHSSASAESTVQTKEKPKDVLKKIDVNTATEDDWKAFPGIGEVLSKRIVKFRSSMHGFTSINDVSKTYGLPDSTFQLILPYLTISQPGSP